MNTIISIICRYSLNDFYQSHEIKNTKDYIVKLIDTIFQFL